MIFPDRGGSEREDYEAARDALVDRLETREHLSDRVLETMRSVPRHAFVPAGNRDTAYIDRPLPIGADQTISAPHMVAIMADRLELSPEERVLEIGTGCGYHAAVTAELVGDEHVYSVEYESNLAERARETLDRLGYEAVSIRVADGHDGWPEHAPYDAAYLTCAAPAIPHAVIDQVREGGRVLAPIGTRVQELVLARRTANGVERSRHERVRFVPMRGGARD